MYMEGRKGEESILETKKDFEAREVEIGINKLLSLNVAI